MCQINSNKIRTINFKIRRAIFVAVGQIADAFPRKILAGTPMLKGRRAHGSNAFKFKINR